MASQNTQFGGAMTELEKEQKEMGEVLDALHQDRIPNVPAVEERIEQLEAQKQILLDGFHQIVNVNITSSSMSWTGVKSQEIAQGMLADFGCNFMAGVPFAETMARAKYR